MDFWERFASEIAIGWNVLAVLLTCDYIALDKSCFPLGLGFRGFEVWEHFYSVLQFQGIIDLVKPYQ